MRSSSQDWDKDIIMGLKLTLQKKLVFIFLTVSLVPVIIITVDSYKIGIRNQQKNIGINLQTASNQSMNEIDRLLFSCVEAITRWSVEEVYQEVIASDPDGSITDA